MASKSVDIILRATGNLATVVRTTAAGLRTLSSQLFGTGAAFKAAEVSAVKYGVALDWVGGSYKKVLVAAQGTNLMVGGTTSALMAQAGAWVRAGSTVGSFGRIVTKQTKSVQQFSDAADKAGDETDQFALQLRGVGQAFLAITAAGRAIRILQSMTSVVATASKSFAALEIEIQRAAALAGASSSQFRLMENAALDASTAALGFSGADVAASFRKIIQSGKSVEESLVAVGPAIQFAVAGVTDLDTAVQTTLSTMFAFNVSSVDIANSLSQMTKAMATSRIETTDFIQAIRTGGAAANITNQSLTSFLTAVKSMRNIGITANAAGTTFKTAMIRMIAPLADARKEIKKWGITLRDQNGQIKQWVDLIEELQVKLSGASKEQQDFALRALFGQRGINAIAASFNVGIDSLRDWQREIERAGDSMEDMSERIMGSFAFQLQKLGANVENFKATVGKDFSPIVGTIIKGINALIISFNDAQESTRGVLEIWAGSAGLIAVAGLMAVAIKALQLAWKALNAFLVGPLLTTFKIVLLRGSQIALVASAIYFAWNKLYKTGDFLTSTIYKQSKALERQIVTYGRSTKELAENAAMRGRAARSAAKEILHYREMVRLHEEISAKRKRETGDDKDLLNVQKQLIAVIPEIVKAFDEKGEALEDLSPIVEKFLAKEKEIFNVEKKNYLERLQLQKKEVAAYKAKYEETAKWYEAQLALIKETEAFEQGADASTMVGMGMEYVATSTMRASEELQNMSDAYEGNIKAARKSAQIQQDSLDDLEKKIKKVSQIDLTPEEFMRVDLKNRTDQMSEEYLAMVQKIGNDTLGYWRKYIEFRLTIAPNHSKEKAKWQAILTDLNADVKKHARDLSREGALSFEIMVEKYYAKVMEVFKERPDIFDVAAQAKKQEASSKKQVSEAERVAAKKKRIMEKGYKEEASALLKSLKLGATTTEKFYTGMIDIVKRAGEEEIATASLINDLRLKANKGLEHGIRLIEDQFKLKEITAKEYRDLSIGFIRQETIAQEAKAAKLIEIDEKIVKSYTDTFNKKWKIQERDRKMGTGSYRDQLALISKTKGILDQTNILEKAYRDELIQLEKETVGKQQAYRLDLAKWNSRLNDKAKEDYLKLLEANIRNHKGSLDQQKANIREFESLVKEVKFETPIQRLGAAADIATIQLRQLGDEYQGLLPDELQSKEAEIQDQVVRKLEEKLNVQKAVIAGYIIMAQKAKETGDVDLADKARKGLLQSREEALKTLAEFQDASYEAGGTAIQNAKWVASEFEDDFVSMFATLDKILGESHAKWISREGLGQKSFDARIAALDEGGEVLDKTLKIFQDSVQTPQQTLATAVGEHTTAVTSMVTQVTTLQKNIGKMAKSVTQQLNVYIDEVNTNVDSIQQRINEAILQANS